MMTISFKDSNGSCTNVYPDWYTLMDVLQGINMKKISSKALICALLTSMLLFTANVISAESKVTTDVTVMQQNVYINKSTIDDLVTLKGIGHKKAQAIVAYRQQIGGFKSVSELINVKGIGEKILSDNKDRLKM
jgi:competence protein ComEA